MAKPGLALIPFACFACHRVFRRESKTLDNKVCPHCGGVAIGLNRKFRAPPRNNEQQWAKVELLVRHGFRFHTPYDEHGKPTRYPTTLRAARDFVRRCRPTPPTEHAGI